MYFLNVSAPANVLHEEPRQRCCMRSRGNGAFAFAKVLHQVAVTLSLAMCYVMSLSRRSLLECVLYYNVFSTRMCSLLGCDLIFTSSCYEGAIERTF